MNKKYYIESVSSPEESDNGIQKAVLSVDGHGECVIVFGDKKDLTTRIIAILGGLNNE